MNLGVLATALLMGFYVGCLVVSVISPNDLTVVSAGAVVGVTTLIVAAWLLKKEHVK